MRWLRSHAKEYNVDPDHIGAYGNSAGGHLALLLAMTGKEAGLEGRKQSGARPGLSSGAAKSPATFEDIHRALLAGLRRAG